MAEKENKLYIILSAENDGAPDEAELTLVWAPSWTEAHSIWVKRVKILWEKNEPELFEGPEALTYEDVMSYCDQILIRGIEVQGKRATLLSPVYRGSGYIETFNETNLEIWKKKN